MRINRPIQVKVFDDLFSGREEETGWHVIQAMTLLKTAQENKGLRSFVVYAAFEMRQAIEQQMFTIIQLVSKERDKAALLRRCKKKDGLFRELAMAEHNYTELCYLMSVLAEAFPKLPPVGNWDIKQLKQYWQKLSGYCHSPQSLDAKLNDRWYRAAIEDVLDVHNYFFRIMESSKGTGNLDMSNATPKAKKICGDFLSRRINRSELKAAIQAYKEQLSES